MQRYLVSVITPNYVLKAGHYLDSLWCVKSAKKVCVLMDTPEPKSAVASSVWRALQAEMYVDVQTPLWSRPDCHSHNMVQWGRFLDALPSAAPDDLICLTDTDLVVQRDLTEAEWSLIEAACADGNFCASWNCGWSDSLLAEAERIRLDQKWLQREFAKIENQQKECEFWEQWFVRIPCFNCGVLFATAATFRRLQAAYESRCAEFYAATSHRSRCQFLMNYCLWIEGIGVAELPASVHVHGHCGSAGLPEGTHWRGTELWVGEEKVVFRHNLEAPQ